MRNSRPMVSKKSQPVRTFSRLKLYAAVLAASQWMVSGPVWAAPEGGEVVGGEGIIQQAGVETIINQATERMAIDWRSFDVAANERVEFIQPSSSSVALNRVLSNRGSEILGRIDANGQVILVNANGVVFGKDSVVNVGGMIASGLNIDPASFINGDFALNSIEGAEGKVINYGIINAATGGSVTLVGEQVQNDGLISAKLGAVNLVAGKAAVLTFDPTGMVGVKVTEAVVQDELGVDAAVINNGSINAEGGRVLLSASVSEDVFSDAVNNAGMNKSTSVVVHDDGSFTLGAGADVINTGNISTSVNQGNAGQVVLLGDNVTHSGSITANTSSGTGGSVELHSTDTTLLTENSQISAQASTKGEGGDIKVLGNKVGLFDQAEVNASGANGGGQVLIGGDKTGQNKQIRNADFIYLGKDTKVKTDALINGNGGKLITFASDTARIYGNLYSRGGGEGGNGGFIETSGLKGFEILNTPDISANLGKGGTWLIDPYSIEIRNVTEDSDGFDPNTAPFISSASSGPILSAESVRKALANGAEVIVQTSGSDGDGKGNGDILISSRLRYNINNNNTATLKLQAHGHININADVVRDNNDITNDTNTGTGSLNLVLQADSDSSGSGSVRIISGRKIETQGGRFEATGVSFDSFSRDDANDTSNDNQNFGTINTSGIAGGGNITIDVSGYADVGSLVFNDSNGSTQSQVAKVSIKAGGDVSLNKEIDFINIGSIANDSASFKIESSGNIAINQSIIDSGDNGLGILNFTLLGHKNGDGSKGNITIASGKTIETRGGYFYAGVSEAENAAEDVNGDGLKDSDIATPTLSAFTSTGATIDTTGELGGGDIVINANGDVALGLLKFGMKYSEANAGRLVRVGSATVFSRANVAFNGLIDFNDSGKRTGAGEKGYAGTLLDNQDTEIRVNAYGNIDINAEIRDGMPDVVDGSWGGDSRDALNIYLTADADNNGVGNIDIDANIYTAGGNFTANAINFDSEGFLINTDRANASTNNDTSDWGNGNATWSNGGNVFINARNTIKLGSITTDSSCTAPNTNACVGNLTLSGIDTDLNQAGIQLSNVAVTQATGSVLKINGDTTFNTGTGTITLENIANNFTKDLILTSAGNTSITDSSAIRLGTSSVTGNLKLTTGKDNAQTSGSITQISAVTVTGDTEFDAIASVSNYVVDLSLANDFGGKVKTTNASSLKLVDINDLSLDAITLAAGATAPSGIIDVTAGAANKIILNGNLNSSAATTKNITLNGDVEVANNTTINAGTGAISFTGTTNSNDATAKNLTLIGGAITFTGNVGNLHKLGDFEIDSTGLVTFADVTAKSFDVSTNNNFIGQNINTSGADSTLAGGVGGDIVISAGSISLASVNTSGGKSTAASGDHAGGNAGKITLTANNSSVSKTITINGGVSAKGGAGSGAGATGAEGVVTLTLANNTFAGQVNLNSDSFLSSNIIVNGSANSTDTLTLTNSKNDWSFTSTNTGTVKETGSLANSPKVSFSGFENITGGTDADTFNISQNITGVINGGDGADTFDINIASLDATVNGGDGENIFNIKVATSKAILNGGDEKDTFNVEAIGVVTATLTGGGGTDIINAANRENEWALGTNESLNTDLRFSGIENITGNADKDIFTFNGTRAVSGTIDAAGGTDDTVSVSSDATINYSGLNFSLFGVDNAEVLSSQAGGILTVTSDATDTIDWQFLTTGSSVTDGTNLVKISNFTSYAGGNGNDDFTVDDSINFTGLINGGSGVNSFKLLNATTAYSIVIASTYQAGSSATLTGINTINANNYAGTSLEVISGTNTWNITGQHEGTVTNVDIGSVSFDGVAKIVGGSGADSINTVNSDTEWSIEGVNSGKFALASAPADFLISFSNIENLIGSAAVDKFSFLDGASVVSAQGNGGLDIADLSKITTDITVTIGGTTQFGFSDVERLIANNQKNFTLAASSGSIWRIYDFDGVGTVSDGVNDGTVAGIEFIDFKTLQGGTGSDTFNLEADFAGTIEGLNGNDIFNIKTAITGTLLGGNGADSFVFFDGGSVATASGGNVDASKDIVDLRNLSTDTTVTLNGSSIYNVDHIERVIANSTKNFTLTTSSVTNIWTIQDFDGAGTLSDGVNDGTVDGIDFVDFNTLQGGTGADVFNLKTNFTGTIEGLGGDDIFNIEVATTGTLLGGAGADSFVFYDLGSVVNADGGTGTAKDVVDLRNITTNKTITLNGTSIYNVANVERAIANNTKHFTLVASAATNTWHIYDVDGAGTLFDGVNDGTVGDIEFIDFKTLYGGSGVDTFTFDTNFTGTIYGLGGDDIFNIKAALSGNLQGDNGRDSFVFYDGGSVAIASGGNDAAKDVVDLRNITTDRTVTLTGTTLYNITNIEQVIANSLKNFTLASSSGSTWRIYDFDGVGTVSDGVNDGTVGGIEFVDFKTLQGGSGSDTFELETDFAGTIEGLNGDDIFNIKTAITGTLLGGNGADSFVFFDGGSVATASGGNVDASKDVVDLRNLSTDTTVTLNGSSIYNVDHIERVIANSTKNFTLTTSSVTNTWTIQDFDGAGTVSDGVNDGTVAGIEFVDFKTLQGGSGSDTFNLETDFAGTIEGLNGDDIFNIKTAITGTLLGGAGADSFVFYDLGSVVNADGGTGTAKDVVDLRNITTNKTITLDGTSIYNVANVERVIANDQRIFTLAASAATNTWHIYDVDGAGTLFDGVNDGTVAGIEFIDFKTLRGGTGTDTFTLDTNFTGTIHGLDGDDIFNIKTTLTGNLQGGNGGDSFVFFDGGSIATANAGTDGGKDVVDLRNITTDTTVTLTGTTLYNITNIEQVIANSLKNFTLASSSGSTWRIYDFDGADTLSDGVNDGTVGGIEFVDFKTLQGGSGSDTFELETDFAGTIEGLNGDDIFNIKTAITGTLLGGNGADSFVFFDGGSVATASGGNVDAAKDVVDLRNLSTDTTVTLNGSSIYNVDHIERVIANSTKNFTLTTSSVTNTWTIQDFDGAGTLSDGVNDGTVAGIEFVDFNTLQGGTGADVFNLKTNFTGTIEGLGGDDIFNIEVATTGTLLGGAGADSFVFYDLGSVVNADGGTGTAKDVVDLRNITTNKTVTLNGTSIYNVANVERVIANNQGTFTLAASAVTNTWHIYDVDGAGTLSDGVNDGTVGGIEFIDFKVLRGGSGADTFTLDTNFSGDIYGLDGDDIFNIKAAITGTLFGGNDADSFVFFDNGSVANASGGNDAAKDVVDLRNITTDRTVTLTGTTLYNITNIEQVIANSLKNFTLAANSGSTWRIYDFDGVGTVSDGVNDGTVGGIEFVDFKTLQGGSGSDTFELETDFAGTIEGLNGDDIFNIKTAITGTLLGGNGADSFVFFDGGSVATASGGNVDAAKDIVDLRNISTDITVTLVGSVVNNVSNVEQLIGSSQKNFTLAASAGTNTWIIQDFDGAGTVSDGVNDGTVAGIDFVDFKTLRGGSGADTFTFDNQSSSIDTIEGGGGADTLIGRNIANTWLVTNQNSGSLVVTGGNTYVSSFSGIQNLTGGSNTDTFELNAAISGNISGGMGNDRFLVNAETGNLFGNDGADQFIFDSANNIGSAKLIDGGNGDDEILGRNVTNTWTINATDAGAVGVTGGLAYITSFTDIQTLIGGSFADVFEINAEITKSIQSGDGNNIFYVNTSVKQLQGGKDRDQFIFGAAGSADSVNGGDGVNSINARDVDNVWSITSSNAGSIRTATNNNYVKNFSNIQELNGGKAADIFYINAAATNIFGNEGTDTFVFNQSNDGSAVLIDGGDGQDILSGRNQRTTWTMTGSNTGNVSISNSIYVTTFVDINSLSGGTAEDILVANNQANTWKINNTNEGTLHATATPADIILFSGMENLLGGQAVDLFTFTANGNVTGLIDGGSSATQNTIKDSLNLSAITGNLAVELGNQQTAALNVVNVEEIIASTNNQDNHVLIGASDTAYRWKITGQNLGVIERAVDPLLETSVNFINFGDLRGGTNSDRFDVQGTVTKSIDGGSGIDLVDYSQRKENFVIVLGGSGGLGNTGINGIEGVVGNSASGNGFTSTIQVNSGDNIWEIGASSNFGDGINDGSITINNNKVSFENFTSLVGGSGADTFKYIENGQWIGNIDGGGGNNTIDSSLSTRDQQFIVNGTALNAGTNLQSISQLIANAATNSSLISSLQSNIWQIDNQGNGHLNSNLDFTNIANLQGGSFVDVFSFANIIWLKGIVDGGGGTDTVNLLAIDKAIQVAVDVQTDADINLVNIETINANNNFSNTLKGDLNGNEWLINAANAGVLNKKINFTGFANLTGSAFADVVVFDNSAATLSGHLDLGDGQDTLDLSASDRDVTVQLNSSKAALASGVLSIDKVEVIKGDVDQSNRLVGDNFTNTWTLDDINSGRIAAVETGTVTFTQFKHISGGNKDDLFVFEALGKVTGLVDGGSQVIRDVVDLSKSNNANVVITTTGESIGFTNVEKYVGNNIDSTLTAANIINNWSLAGVNRGTLNESIEFESFGVLKGGNKQDNFVINNATISGDIDSGDGDDTFDIRASAIAGKIKAGAGDDRFTFTIASGAEGTADIDGGEGANRLTIEGGDADYKVSHQLGRHEYASAAGNTYSILYSNVLNVFDNVLAKSLSIFGTTTADTFRLLTGRYNINNLSTVNYTNKANLIINGTADDQAIVDGTVGIESTVTFNNLRVLAENAGKIQAQSLELVNTGSVGSATARLNTAVNDLSLSATNGAVYLDEQDALVFKNFNVSTTELVDIKAGGNLTSAGSLTYSGNLNLESSRGNIDLGNNNSLAGTVSLKAAGNVTLDNLQALSLGDLVAQNATLGSSTSIKGLGVFSVAGLTTLNAGNEISLMNVSNDINQITVARASKLDLFDSNGFTTVGLNVTNDTNLHSSGGIILSTSCTADCNNTSGINTKNLRVQSDAAVTVAKSIAAADTINIESQGLTINDSITSKQFTLNALNGKLTLNDSGNLLGQEGTSIDLTANNIEQRAKIVSGGNVKVNAAGDVTMADAAVMESVNGDIALNGNNLQLATLNATKGSTTITAQGIVANKSITSKQISLNAGNGKIVLNTDGNLFGQEGTGVELTANTIEQHSKIISGGNLKAVATGDITMFTSAEMESLNGSIVIDGNNLQLASLKSANGSTTTTAKNAIKDGNGSAINIVATRWQADAMNGIGSGLGDAASADAIETNVDVLSVRNAGSLGNAQESNINIANNKALKIEQLANNGDISISNLGDIVLDNTNSSYFDLAKTDARIQGGVINSGADSTSGGQLLLTISGGMVRAENVANAKNPDIIANVATFKYNSSFDFGERNRKIVMYIPEVYNQNARLSFVKWYEGIKPKVMNDLSKVPSDSIISGRDQLIQIEGLSEIDPAIFTNLRNYVHDEVAILLPLDQRFDDSEDL